MKSVTLPESNGKKLLIFDMDETLIHCLSNSDEEARAKEVDVEI